MDDHSPRAVLSTVLARTGLSFPRGMLGPETARLAHILNGADAAGADSDDLVTQAAAALWPLLQPSTHAALERFAAQAPPGDEDALRTVMAWSEDPSPEGNPLARALCVRAAQELAGALDRARRLMEGAEPAVGAGGPSGAVAAATAAGQITIELLDLDPDDFGAEIVAYVEDDESPEALDTLTRSTGDEETRAWAREAVAGVAADPRDTPTVAAALAHLAEGEPPPDPATDAVWVPTMLALVQAGFERALTSG